MITRRPYPLLMSLALIGGLTLTLTSAQSPSSAQSSSKKRHTATKNATPKKTTKRATSPKLVAESNPRNLEDKDKGKEKDGEKEAPHVRIPGRFKITNATKRLLAGEEGGAGEYKEIREHLIRLKSYPNKEVDWEAYSAARDKATQLPPATPAMLKGFGVGPGILAVITPTPVSLAWEFVGPTNIDPPYQQYYGTQPIIGRIGALAYDPKLQNVIYVGGANGGLWKSTNNGTSWTSIMDKEVGMAVSSIAIDPVNSNVIYVGTGDYDGGSVGGFGLFKSIDGGKTWKNLDPTHAIFGTFVIHKILIDNTVIDKTANQSSGVIAIGGGFRRPGHIYRSLNSGGAWNTVLTSATSMNDVVFNSDKSIAYASADLGKLYKSLDRGNTWVPVNSIFPGRATGRLDVAASIINPLTVYAIDASDFQGVFYKSVDGGIVWTSTILDSGAFSGQWGQSWYDFYLGASYKNVPNPNGIGSVKTDTLIVGLFSVYQSPDAGATWYDAGLSYRSGTKAHSDQHTFAFNPLNPAVSLVGGDGGVYRYVFPATANPPTFTFTSLNNGLGITQFYNGAVGPTDTALLLGGTQDNATPQANGDTVHWRNPGAGDGFGCGINFSDPFNKNTVLRGYQNQYLSIYDNVIIVTEDNWNTGENITPTVENPTFFTPFWFNNNDPLFAYTATNKIYEYTHPALGVANTNTAWTAFGQDFGAYVTGFATSYTKQRNAAGNSEYLIYAGTDTGGFWASDDHGGTFVQLDNFGKPGGLPNRPITSVTVSPFNPRKVWVTLAGGGGVARVWSTDNAFTGRWYSVSGNLPDLPVNTLALVPSATGNTIYVGTDAGVYYTSDGGKNWFDATVPLGMPRVTVNQLVFAPSTGYLNAFTYGRGVWRLQVGNTVPFSAYPYLQGYRGDRSRLKATLAFYATGTNVLLETRQVNLTATGFANLNISYKGNADLLIKVPGFLTRRIPAINTDSTGALRTPIMYAGDVNGDDVVDANDLNAITAKLGQFTSGPEDIDGDGRVTTNDVALAQANQGQRGDN